LEDTFRTLTAVDSVIVVIDVAKVWKNKQRNWSQYVDYVKFYYRLINKMDREGKDAFDLMDEVEQKWD
jgi:peptide chain release factor 3